MFFGCAVPPDSKKAELGSTDQESSSSAGKNTGVILEGCRVWKCVPTAISECVDIPEVPGYRFLPQISSQ